MITKEYLKNLLMNGYDISGIDYSHITDMSYMFVNNDFISYIPDFDVSCVENMEGMFYGCRQLMKSPLVNTSKATNMKSLFSGCFELTTVCDLDTSSVIDADDMFKNCSSLKYLDPLDLSTCYSAKDMLDYCFELDFDLTKWKIHNDLNILDMTHNAFHSAEEFIDCVGLDYSIAIILDNKFCDPFFEKALLANSYNSDITEKITKIIQTEVINKY